MAAGHRYWPEFPRRSLAVGLFARFQHGGRTARRAVGIASENNPSHKRCSMLKSPSEWFVSNLEIENEKRRLLESEAARMKLPPDHGEVVAANPPRKPHAGRAPIAGRADHVRVRALSTSLMLCTRPFGVADDRTAGFDHRPRQRRRGMKRTCSPVPGISSHLWLSFRGRVNTRPAPQYRLAILA